MTPNTVEPALLPTIPSIDLLVRVSHPSPDPYSLFVPWNLCEEQLWVEAHHSRVGTREDTVTR